MALPPWSYGRARPGASWPSPSPWSPSPSAEEPGAPPALSPGTLAVSVASVVDHPYRRHGHIGEPGPSTRGRPRRRFRLPRPWRSTAAPPPSSAGRHGHPTAGGVGLPLASPCVSKHRHSQSFKKQLAKYVFRFFLVYAFSTEKRILGKLVCQKRKRISTFSVFSEGKRILLDSVFQS